MEEQGYRRLRDGLAAGDSVLKVILTLKLLMLVLKRITLPLLSLPNFMYGFLCFLLLLLFILIFIHIFLNLY